MLDLLLHIDRELFFFFNGLHSTLLDPVMYYISLKTFWIPFYLVLFLLCYRYYGWKVLLIMVFVTLLITLSDQLSVFLKDSLQRYRPSRDADIQDFVHIVNDKRGGRYGFVSSHASNSFAFALFMIYLLKTHLRYIAPVMIGWALLKSYSRIYLGVHYPGDVLGGAILGVLCAWLVVELWKLMHKKILKKHQNLLKVRQVNQ